MSVRRIESWPIDRDSVLVHELAAPPWADRSRAGGTAFLRGEWGLPTALYQAGYTLTERDPDHGSADPRQPVAVGEQDLDCLGGGRKR